METFIPPSERANKLLSDLEIAQIPTPVEEICRNLNIKCDYTTEITTEAFIIKGGKKKPSIIVVNANSQYESRARFSVAHELGHYCIPSHLNEIYRCSVSDLNNYPENKAAEKEANVFAAEPLMPSSWIQQ